MKYHAKLRLFSLVGRRIVLNVPYHDCYITGVIVEQIGPAQFSCRLKSNGLPPPTIPVNFHRSEFCLPPLPRIERRPEYLDENYDGFVYADNPDFVNKFARVPRC